MNELTDKSRYNLAFKLALSKYWHETKRNWKFSIPGLFLPSINTILVAYVPPLAVSQIVATAADNQTHQFSDFTPYILLFVGSWILGEVVMRIGIHYMIKAEVYGTQRLYEDGLKLLLSRDLSFFHDNFAGSLTKKTTGYANRYIDVFDTMGYNVISKTVPVIFASIVLAFYSPLLVICLLGWLIVTYAAIYPLILKRRELVTL